MSLRVFVGIVVSATLASACGMVIGAEWDTTLRPNDAGADDGPSSSDASAPEGGGGGSDACTRPVVATSLAAGSEHTCAIDGAGDVLCWGSNYLGELGTGSWSVPSIEPVRVVGLSGVTAIASSYAHTCAIDGAGDVWCWGWNGEGQLGGGAATPRSVATPIKVAGLPAPASAVAAGWAHSCAVAGGALYCWGYNRNGQLGIGSTSLRELTPRAVVGLSSGVTQVAANLGHTCAIVSGAIKCWGNAGLLGDGTLTASAKPVDVVDIEGDATSIATGAGFSCAVVAGTVKCWGYNDGDGLGDPGKTRSYRPNDVPGVPAGATFIAASDHACALVAGGVRCWGGYPGDGTTASPVAVTVSGAPSANTSALAVGSKHACTVTSGEVWCWGSGSNGKLGAGTGGASEVLRPTRACYVGSK